MQGIAHIDLNITAANHTIVYFRYLILFIQSVIHRKLMLVFLQDLPIIPSVLESLDAWKYQRDGMTSTDQSTFFRWTGT